MNSAADLYRGEFRKYIAASLLTALGNGVHFVALAWFVYTYTGSVASVGLTFIVSSVPGILFSPWIGVLVDRWNQQRICVWTDVLRGVAVFLLVLAVYYDRYVTPAIYITSFLVAVCNIFFQPAIGALVRDSVSKENLLRANVAGNIVMQVGMLVGASAGGLLVDKVGVSTVLALNAGSFFLSGAITMMIRTRPITKVQQIQRRIAYATELKQAYSYFMQNRYFLWLATLQVAGYITLYVCNTLLPVFVDKELHKGSEALGLIDAAWGGGAIVGGLALTYLVKKLPSPIFLSGSGVLLVLSMLLFAAADNVISAVAGYFCLGFFVCIIRVGTDTILVDEVRREYFGRVKSSITMVISYMSLIVYACVGRLGDSVSVRSIFVSFSSIVALALIARLCHEPLSQTRKKLFPKDHIN